jgi:hypothetical protein
MAAAAANPFAQLLDFSGPVDVEAVESTVNIFYGAGAQDQVRGALSLAAQGQGVDLQHAASGSVLWA